MTRKTASAAGLLPANLPSAAPDFDGRARTIGRLDGTTPILTEQGWTRIGFHDGAALQIWTGSAFAPMQVRSLEPERRKSFPLVAVRLSDGADLLCAPEQLLPLHETGPTGEVASVREALAGERLARGGWPMIEGPLPEGLLDGLRDAEAEARVLTAGEEAEEVKALDHYTQGFWQGDGWVETKSRAERMVLCGTKRDIPHPWPAVSRKTYQQAGTYPGSNNANFRDYLRFARGTMRPKGWLPYGSTLADRRAWLAGYIDSDGSVGAGSAQSVSCGKRPLLAGIKLLVNTMGANAHLGGSNETGWRLNIASGWSQNLSLPVYRCRLTRVVTPKPSAQKIAEVRAAGRAERLWTLEPLDATSGTAAAGGLLVA